MSDGPTTVGSIVGKLRLDMSQWDIDVAKVKDDTRQLGALNPQITVKTNVAEAIAEMEALHTAAKKAGVGPVAQGSPATVGATVSAGAAAKVDSVSAAERRLEAATVSATAASALAESAEDRRWRTEQKLSATLAEKSAAQDAATRAVEKADLAAIKLAAAEEGLAAAQKKAAQAALEDAAAQETDAKATDTAGQSMGRLQRILTAVVALGPGLIPIAGFAVGAGAAITAMLGIGVLAILGIKNELKTGSADAAAFAADLGSLKGDLADLEQTAAHGILGGFSSVVSQVHADMPALNSETSLYSSLLGKIASTGFGGLLAAWTNLQPLVIDVGQYLEQSTGRLAAFADSPEFRRFVTYAQQELPTVGTLLNSLVTVAFHLLQAFAPWGTVVVGTLQGLVNVIDAMPLPVLSTLIELALGGSLAFKAWTSIPALMMSIATTIGATTAAEGGATVATGALGAAIDFMTGPVGWAVAGLGALIAVLTATTAAQNNAIPPVNGYTAALQEDNGVLGEHIRLQAAKNLQDSGALDAAKRLGVSTQALTLAATGNVPALKAVNAELDKATSGWKASGSAMVNNSKAAGSVPILAKLIRDSLKDQQSQLGSTVTQWKQLQIATGATTASTNDQTDAYAALAREEDAATAAGKLWKNQLDILNGGQQSLESATIALAGDYQSAAQTIKQNIKEMGRAEATSLDIHTKGGLANHQIVLQEVTDAETRSQAVIQSEGETAKAREDGRKALVRSRQSIIDHMTAAGLDKKAVTALVDSELKIPPEIKNTITTDTSAATKSIKNLVALMNETLSNVIIHVSAKGAISYSTQGGRVEFHSGGGTVGGSGSSTSDSNLAALSVGEEVIRTSRAQPYRPVLKAINNGSQRDIQSELLKLLAPQSSPSVPAAQQTRNWNLTLNQYNPVAVSAAEAARTASIQALAILQMGGP